MIDILFKLSLNCQFFPWNSITLSCYTVIERNRWWHCFYVTAVVNPIFYKLPKKCLKPIKMIRFSEISVNRFAIEIHWNLDAETQLSVVFVRSLPPAYSPEFAAGRWCHCWEFKQKNWDWGPWDRECKLLHSSPDISKTRR